HAPTSHARVTLVYVASELSAVTAAAGEAGVQPGEERRLQLEEIEQELRDFVRIHFGDVPADTRVLEGDVAESISDVAAELRAAFLVVGTRGRSALSRLILGDTTHSILQHAPCPVVVVPLHGTPSGG
ncbi:MAG TPA: universal stress protein, partial [Longimicrobiales bacterium]|nr:universal stress protein [Longimicrobiales bacterium]